MNADGTQTTKTRTRKTYAERVEELRQQEAARAARQRTTIVKEYEAAAPVRDRAETRAEEANVKVAGIVDRFVASFVETALEKPTHQQILSALRNASFAQRDITVWTNANPAPAPTIEGQTTIEDN